MTFLKNIDLDQSVNVPRVSTWSNPEVISRSFLIIQVEISVSNEESRKAPDQL